MRFIPSVFRNESIDELVTQRTTSLLDGVAWIAARIPELEQAEPAIRELLETLGESAGLPVACLARVGHGESDEPEIVLRNAWAADEIAADFVSRVLDGAPLSIIGITNWEHAIRAGIANAGSIEGSASLPENAAGYLAVPLRTNQQPLGLLILADPQGPIEFSDLDISIVGIAAQAIASLLHASSRTAATEEPDEGRAMALQEIDDEPGRAYALLRAVTTAAAMLLHEHAGSDAITEALHMLGEATGVTSVALIGVQSDPPDYEPVALYHETWEHSQYPIAEESYKLSGQPISGSGYEGWTQKLRRGEMICGLVRELPDEERNLLEPIGVKSILSIPIFIRGELWGEVTFADRRSERRWSEREVAVLRLVTIVIAETFARQGAERASERKDQLLQAVSEVAGQLVREVDFRDGLKSAMASLGQATNATRVTVYEFHPHPDTGLIASSKWDEWTREGVEPRTGISSVQNIPFEGDRLFDGWYRALAAGDSVGGPVQRFSDDLQSFFHKHNLQSIYLVPVMTSQGVWGYIGLYDHNVDRLWSSDEQSILLTAASILGGAIDRQRSDRALRRTDSRFSAMVQNSTDIITLINADGEITYQSPSTFHLLGYAPDDILGDEPFNLVHPDDIDDLQGTIHHLINGEELSGRVEFRVRDTTGTWHYLESLATNLLDDPSVRGIVINSRDITDRKAFEVDLQRKSVILQAVAEATSDLLVQPDLDAGVASALEKLGRAAQASRVSVYRFHRDPESNIPHYSKEYEWVREGLEPRMEGPAVQNVPVKGEIFEKWFSQLVRGETLGGYLPDLPPPVQQHYAQFNIQSVLLMPIFAGSEAYGLIDINNEESDYVWSDDEQAILRVAASALGGAIARRNAESAVQESEERFRAMVQHSSDMIALTDVAGVYDYVSPSIHRLLGLDPADMIGQSAIDFIHPEEQPRMRLMLESIEHEPGETRQIEVRHRTVDGLWRVLDLIITNHLEAPEVKRLVFNGRDISERKALEDRLSWQAFHDPLTGLANRTLFLVQLEHTVARHQRRDENFAVLFIDLDRFKVINDSLGHGVGDELLVMIARRLESALRPGDLVARLGGDEFTMIIEHVEHQSAARIVNRLIDELSRPITLPAGHRVVVNASVGIALSTPDDRPSSDDLLRRADIALYRAKSEGRGRWERFDDQMNKEAIERHSLEIDLRRALESGELVLHYQPEIDLSSGGIVGFEALLRWEHPDRGLLDPDIFMSIAEDSGLLVPIGRWVLREACRQMREWQNSGLVAADTTISVNMAASEHQSDLVNTIATVLEESQLDAGSLRLEITEGSLFQESQESFDLLIQIHDLGVQLAIDDFGAGQSSLSYLTRMPVEVLKIHRMFTAEIDDPHHRAIVEAVTSLAHAMDMIVTAEGVEDAVQMEIVRGIGCDRVQGYYVSSPIPASEVPALVEIVRDAGKE